jgi:hypothetical protein
MRIRMARHARPLLAAVAAGLAAAAWSQHDAIAVAELLALALSRRTRDTSATSALAPVPTVGPAG